MNSYLLVVLVLAINGQSSADSVTDGTELIGAILLHRHGDRTPTSESNAELSTDPAGVIAASAPFGYGQLTEAGKQRSYKLGLGIRHRFDDLLSPRYNISEIYIRSTDFTRTKMTTLVAMSAVYPAYPGSWSKTINWVPTPYTTVAPKYDYNIFTETCPKYLQAFSDLLYEHNTRLDPYFDVLNIISEAIGTNITKIPWLVLTTYDAFVAQDSLGVPLGDEIAKIMPELKKAADEAIDIFLRNKNYIRLQAGVLLDEFFTQADNLISGRGTPPIRIYSAHDLNVYSFESVAKVVERQGCPQYTSAFSLELRRVKDTDQYLVLPVYYESGGALPKYLQVDGCDGFLCDYDTYKELVSEYTVDEETWRTECGWSEDIVVDDVQ